MRRKKDDKIKKVADICGCSPKQVRNRLAGISGNKRVTKLGETIDVAFVLLEQGENELIDKLKKQLNAA